MTLVKYILKRFFPVFLGALILAALVLNLVDILINLWRYIQNQVPASAIFKIMLYYVPKTVWYAIPLAILFATSYTLSALYAKNELTAAFVCGVSLFRFTLPLLILSFCSSIFLFFLDNKLAVETYAKKKALQDEVLHITKSETETAAVVMAEDGKIIYKANYYDDSEKQLSHLYCIFRSDEKKLIAVIYSPRAKWNQDESKWKLENAIQYSIIGSDASKNVIKKMAEKQFLDRLVEPSETFKNTVVEIEEVNTKIAKEYIQHRIKKGLPYNEALSLYYKKFAFPFIVFIVVFLSIGLSGKTKKNVMLTSTALSIASATLFYVTQMITMLLAKFGYLSAFVGAWFPVFLFV
ncbi:MAG: LptF/LptG family permease, partial [Treponema sp.]|nr:LptF/LptG family permease [Treponema sp.]